MFLYVAVVDNIANIDEEKSLPLFNEEDGDQVEANVGVDANTNANLEVQQNANEQLEENENSEE